MALNEHPIVAELDRQMRDRILKEVKEKEKTRFVWEKWHVVSVLIGVSLVCSVFYAQIMALSAFLIAYLCLDTFLEFKSKYGAKPSVNKEDIGLVDVGEDS
jgi:hypothetical protein